MRRILTNQSGQMLLIASMIMIVLLITIPSIVFINNVATRHGVTSLKNQKAVSTSLEGLAYAMHVLALPSTTNWVDALGTNTVAAKSPTEFGPKTSPKMYTATSGDVFAITCCSGNSTAKELNGYEVQRYQTQIVVQGGQFSTQLNKPLYGRSRYAIVSKKTLAAVLPSEVRASAALELMRTPAPGDSEGLVVHWGPVVVFDTTTWQVGGAMDTGGFPRKFSQGPITGTVPRSVGGPDTDNKEYWANSALAFPNAIDLNAYKTKALNTILTNGQRPQDATGALIDNSAICPGGTFCGFFNTTAYFTGTPTPYSLVSSTSFIYVEGNAVFGMMNVDLKVDGAIIVTGNLTLATPAAETQKLLLRVPPTAGSEYPSGGPSPTWPCNWKAGSNCVSTLTGLGGGDVNGLGSGAGNGKVPFRGFLYVQKNLIATNTGWLLAGAVRVDGKLIVPAGTGGRPQLAIVYDDQINHNILATPLELMIDYQRESTPCYN